MTPRKTSSGVTSRRRGKLTPVAIDGRDHLSTAQAAAYLGVRVQTLYAYVSRGVLNRTTIAGRRGSFFALTDIEELATRSRAPRAPGTGDRIHTQVTLIGPDDTLAYRGRDVPSLVAGGARYEDVCAILWRVPGPPGSPDAPRLELVGRPGDADLAAAAVAALPAGGRGIDLLKVCVDLLGASDPLRGDLRPERVHAAAARILAGCVAALTLRAGRAPARPGGLGPAPLAVSSPRADRHEIGSFSEATTSSGSGDVSPVPTAPLAERLAAALSAPVEARSVPGGGEQVRLLDAAMCLLADHDLAMSTRAARVAASARAHPYGVVGAALAGMDSPLHGLAPRTAHRLLADAIDDPDATIAQVVASGEVPEGFGHRIYRRRDPRAEALLALLRESAAGHPAITAADRLAEAMRERHDTFVTSDVALAALAHVMGWRTEAGELIFALARIAGWIAHALEEYEAEPLRYRIAGVYSGARPPG